MEAPADATALSRARERFASRDYHGAVMLLREAVDDGIAYADSWHLLGLSLALIGRPQEAIEAFDQAVQKNPRYVEAHLNRGIVLVELGREEDARASFVTAEQLGQPDASGFPAIVANRLANAHAALGDDYCAAGAPAEALAEYEKALHLRPRFADVHVSHGRALMELGEFVRAGTAFEQATTIRPNWLDAMLLRGLAAYLSGDLDAAGRLWEETSSHHPEEPRVEIYRSMLARRAAGQG